MREISRNATDGGRVPRARSVLVALSLGLAATAGTYLIIKRHEVRELDWVTQIAAQTLRADISADVDSETAGLIRLAMLGQRVSPAGKAWEENAGLFIQRRPGCMAIEALTPTYARTSIVRNPAEQLRNRPLAFNGVPVDLLKAAVDTGAPVLSPFIAAADRSAQRITVMPMGLQRDSSGFVVAYFDAATSFDDMMEDVKDLGFSVSILEGGREQYRTASKEVQPRFTQLVKVPLPGVTWEIRVWPKAATLSAMDARIPNPMLIMGALISFLLASTAHFASSAKAQSRRLERVNTKLIDEMRAREQADEQVRRARDQLESKVQQRTAELLAANARLEHEIVEHARAEESLQKLAGQLFQTQDEERRRLARELHDGTTQNLIAVAMNLASIRRLNLSTEQERELLDDTARLIQQSVVELRTISHLLHPPMIDELGLPAILRSYADGFSVRSGIGVAVVLDRQLGRLARELELGIFRIVQESLANIHRHSNSRTADILLCREDGRIRLEISDQGRGIPPEILRSTERGLAGVGIAGMRERVRLLGGHFGIHSDDRGTSIRILLPATDSKPREELVANA